jgi:hypothetical protein
MLSSKVSWRAGCGERLEQSTLKQLIDHDPFHNVGGPLEPNSALLRNWAYLCSEHKWILFDARAASVQR